MSPNGTMSTGESHTPPQRRTQGAGVRVQGAWRSQRHWPGMSPPGWGQWGSLSTWPRGEAMRQGRPPARSPGDTANTQHPRVLCAGHTTSRERAAVTPMDSAQGSESPCPGTISAAHAHGGRDPGIGPRAIKTPSPHPGGVRFTLSGSVYS